MSEGVRALTSRTGPVARLAIVLAALGLVVFVFSLRGLANAILTPSAQQAKKEVNDQIKKLAGEYTLALDGQVKQFNGRSVFFIPSAPVPPPPPPKPEDHSTPPPPPPPPPPSKYEGPKLIAMINGVAWFDDGKKLAAGDEAKEIKLKVKSLDAPYGVVVDWDGIEFKVPLFERDVVVFPPPKKEEPKSAVPEESKAAMAKEPVKETSGSGVSTGKKPETPESPKPESPKPDAPKPEVLKADEPQTPKPETPTPDQPKTDKPDSPGSPAGQIEIHE